LNSLVIKGQHTARMGRLRKLNEDAILVAAAKAFGEHHYFATSIDDLCEATDFLRGGLSR
jgi:AcrR family transcriptional regulator